MAQTTTTMIFLLATLLIAATTTVSGQGSTLAPSPDGMDCAEGLTACAPSVFQNEKISQECCNALETAAETQLPCLCEFINDPELPINVTEASALIFKTCGLTIGPSLCSETPAPTPLPED